MRTLALLSSLLLASGTAVSQEASSGTITVYRGAKLYPGSGPALSRSVIVVKDRKFEAVGTDVELPEGAKVVDVSRAVILPGLIDAASPLYADRSTRSAGSAEHDVLDALDLYQEDWKEVVGRGVTTVYVGPFSTGAINGQGAVLRLDGKATPLVRGAALKITLGAATGDVSTAAQRYGSYRQVRQMLDGARRYREGHEKYRKDLAEYRKQKKADPKKKLSEPKKPRKDPRNEVLLRVLRSKDPLPVRIEVHSSDSIQLALRLIEEFKLRAVLEQATEGVEVAAEIAKAKVPVVAGPVFRYGPRTLNYLRHSIGTPALLKAAGVRTAIGSFGNSGAGASRFLLDAAARASSKGMTVEQAIATVTLEPARILGVDKQLGSVEKGKRADLVILSGDPFDAGTRVEKTVIDGRVVFARGGE